MNCPECGLDYAEDVASDRRLHRVFHDETVSGVPLRPIGTDSVIWRNGDDRILLVTAYSPLPQRVRARKVGRVANREMRYDFGLYHEYEKPDERNIHLFIYCRNGRAVALAIFERRNHVCRYTWDEVDRGLRKDLVEQVPIWSLGFIWTHKLYRRKGIARVLFAEAARLLKVSLGEVGLYAPFSDNGKAFARDAFPGGFLVGK